MILGGVLASAAITHADPSTADDHGFTNDHGSHWRPEARRDVWLDVGVGYETVAPGDNVTYSAPMVRLAVSTGLGPHVYIGFAFTAGKITAADGTPSGELPAVSEGSVDSDPSRNAEGNILAPQIVLGLRETTGAFAGAVELAPTERWTNGAFTYNGLERSMAQSTIEIHGRVDAWITPFFTVGALAGVDVDSVHDLQAALFVGVHAYAYDRIR